MWVKRNCPNCDDASAKTMILIPISLARAEPII